MARSKTERNKIVKRKMSKIINLDQQKLLQHKTSRCVSTMIKPLRIFQFVCIGHLSFFIRLRFKIGYQISLHAIKFSLKTARSAATVHVHDLYDRYGSYADKCSCLHSPDCPVRCIRFRLSRRVDQPLCWGRLAHYSGNLRRTVYTTVQ